MQCQICSNLLPDTLNYLKPDQLATIFVDEHELSLSAQSGKCAECKLLFDAISLKRPEWAQRKEDSLSIVVNVAINKPVQIIWNKVGVFLQIFRLYGKTEHDYVSQFPGTIGQVQLIPEFSESEESFSTLESWFSECRSSHDLCRSSKPPAMPTRVIDVGLDTPSTGDVSLIETSSMRGEYAALSYCWGDPNLHQVLKTVWSNIEQMKSRIAFGSLPKTLQHAVILVRKLGLRYLWIDALCIIQDDEDDWRTEAAKMCDVYSNAAITVVACRSDGSSGGIFGTQKYSFSTKVPYKQTFVNVSEDYGRDHEYNILLHERSDLDPVHKRAWTLQEAVLSSRAVFFTSQEMRWECNTCRKCQCGKLSKQYPPKFDPDEVLYELYRTWRLNDFFPATTIDEAYEQWFLMYTFYTSRTLTNDTDRLVALSGLARRFAEIMKIKFNREEQYLAGVWLGSLPRDLLWMNSRKDLSRIPDRQYGRPIAWRAPTWSWAAMEADVQRYSFRKLQSRVQIVKASVELAGSDPFGQVKEGKLNFVQIEGPVLKQMRFNRDPDIPYPEQRFTTVIHNGCSLRIEFMSIDDDKCRETDTLLVVEPEAFVVLIVGYSPGGDIHEALVLRAVAEQQQTYERFAYVRLGPHLREPKENRKTVEDVPRCVVTLI